MIDQVLDCDKDMGFGLSLWRPDLLPQRGWIVSENGI
jgi:hypothetical protein